MNLIGWFILTFLFGVGFGAFGMFHLLEDGQHDNDRIGK